MSAGLTHIDASGAARMVDVSEKPVSVREAIAEGRITLAVETLELIAQNAMAKGDVLATARIAGIQAAKRTADLIPLCHPLPLSGITLDLVLEPDAVRIACRVRTTARTGVEMEALTGVAIAGLTIYDMCKAVDPAMTIGEIRLVLKTKEAL